MKRREQKKVRKKVGKKEPKKTKPNINSYTQTVRKKYKDTSSERKKKKGQFLFFENNTQLRVKKGGKEKKTKARNK